MCISAADKLAEMPAKACKTLSCLKQVPEPCQCCHAALSAQMLIRQAAHFQEIGACARMLQTGPINVHLEMDIFLGFAVQETHMHLLRQAAQACRELGAPEAETYAVDLTDGKQLAGLVHQLEAKYQMVNVLVNNAGEPSMCGC